MFNHSSALHSSLQNWKDEESENELAVDLSHSGHFDSSNTGVTNHINYGSIPFGCFSARAPVLTQCVAYWHT